MDIGKFLLNLFIVFKGFLLRAVVLYNDKLNIAVRCPRLNRLSIDPDPYGDPCSE